MPKHVLRVRINGEWRTGEYEFPEFLARYLFAIKTMPSEDVQVNAR